MKKVPYALIIMDGYGLAPAGKGNAISINGSKNVAALMREYPSASLGASGEDVGLPKGQMGNSEVGHMNIGAGRIVFQDLKRITAAIKNGDFFENPVLLKAMDAAKNNRKKLHLMGLIGPGGVHSHSEHLYALLKMAKARGLDTAYVHCFTDGRDTAPTSGTQYVRELQDEIKKLGFGKIASLSGRYYAMDRDNNWERVEKAYDMLTIGNGKRASDPVEALKESYAAGVTDEYVLPVNIYENGKPVALIEKGDSVIFFNFRPDRARQLTRAISQKEFVVEDKKTFERKTGFLEPHFVCFTLYDADFKDVDIAFPFIKVDNTLGEYLSKIGKTQLRIAETEKYGHVTFFFNGGEEKPFPGEERDLVASSKVKTHDLKPEMCAYEVTDRVLKWLDKGIIDVIILNYANCDIVGHTGNIAATVKAVGAVDECVKKVTDKIIELGGTAILTADHGNADCLIREDGSMMTAHTTNPVPVILISEKLKNAELRKDGILADLAPTLLDIMGLPLPAEMTGKSLIKH